MSKSVVIGVISTGMIASVKLAGWLFDAKTSLGKIGWDASFINVNGAKPIEYARNLVCGAFLQTDAERLLFMDSDSEPPESIEMLMETDSDIASCAVPIWLSGEGRAKPIPTFSVWDRVGGGYAPSQRAMRSDREVEVDAVGGGVMLIKREVLESPEMSMGDQTPPAIFRTLQGPNGKIILGQDLDFCDRAKSCGFTVSYVPGVVFGHRKNLNLIDVITFAMGSES